MSKGCDDVSALEIGEIKRLLPMLEMDGVEGCGVLTMLGMDGVEGLWWVTNVEHGWR